ncbi:MAG: hypothetical protein ACTHLE_08465 [Agriterribacter sp.]
MSALAILLTGIVATALMTAFMNTCAVVSKRNLYTVRILTEMLATFSPGNTNRSIGFYRTVAVTVHYGIGVLFVWVYCLLRGTHGYIGHLHSMEWWIIGVIYGMVGVSGWVIFTRLHPAPPGTVPWSLYLLCIFVGHLIFTLAMMWLIGTFQSNVV